MDTDAEAAHGDATADRHAGADADRDQYTVIVIHSGDGGITVTYPDGRTEFHAGGTFTYSNASLAGPACNIDGRPLTFAYPDHPRAVRWPPLADPDADDGADDDGDGTPERGGDDDTNQSSVTIPDDNADTIDPN